MLQSLGGTGDLTLKYYQQVFAEPAYLKILGETFKISAIVTVVTSVMGYPLAYWISRLSRRGRLIALTLVIMPFWTSTLVRTYAWVLILGFKGVVNQSLLTLGLIGSPWQLMFNNIGVTIGMVHVLMPFLVLPLVAAMMGVDERLMRAGRSLGAAPRAVFWRVFFPLTLPALSANAILIFILSLGFFVAPAILGGGHVPMIAPVLDTLINAYPQWEVASVLSILLLVVCLLLFALYRRTGALVK
jgi:ABC-type spermidine/putrescine transport system permease subunit I